MEIGSISSILVGIGGLCLIISGLLNVYYLGLKAGRDSAINDIFEILRNNSDEKGICKIQTNKKD